jgi:hypothetical protein
LFEDIKSKFYDSQSNFEASKDFDKFNTDIGSPRSQSSRTSKSSSSKLPSFKDLMNETYDDYLAKIKGEYPTYKNNHRKTQPESSKIIISDLQKSLSLYQSSQKIYKMIPAEFFTEEGKKYKINKDILEKKSGEMQKYMSDLIEKCGDVELELDRILEHSHKLYYYINQNMSINDILEFCVYEINKMKESKNRIKEKYLINTAKSIKHGLKRKNIITSVQTMRIIKSLKEMIDLLKVLCSSSSKNSVALDLIKKSKLLLSNLFQITQGKLKIAKNFTDEFSKYAGKLMENALNDLFANMIIISSENILNEEKYKTLEGKNNRIML